jgi:hypothetical protein
VCIPYEDEEPKISWLRCINLQNKKQTRCHHTAHACAKKKQKRNLVSTHQKNRSCYFLLKDFRTQKLCKGMRTRVPGDAKFTLEVSLKKCSRAHNCAISHSRKPKGLHNLHFVSRSISPWPLCHVKIYSSFSLCLPPFANILPVYYIPVYIFFLSFLLIYISQLLPSLFHFRFSPLSGTRGRGPFRRFSNPYINPCPA